MQTEPDFTIVIPVFNEEGIISDTIQDVLNSLKEMNYEIVVVNDGSTDDSAANIEAVAENYEFIRLINSEVNKGYGAALKLGIRSARTEHIVIVDGDGSYPVHKLPELIAQINNADMVVGARTGENVEYSRLRMMAKVFLKFYVSWITGVAIPDMNSGMRVLKKSIVEKYLGILPDSFSFTTTITLAMLTNSYNVIFIPIDYTKRTGKSKIQPVRDTLKFLQLIIRTGIYFAPVRVLAPLIIILFVLFSCSFLYDILILQNLTDKTILLLMFSMNTGLFALIADMIDKRVNK